MQVTNGAWNSSVLGLILIGLKKPVQYCQDGHHGLSQSSQWPAAVGWLPMSGLTNALVKTDKQCLF
jgi:hypothetical protein